MIGMLAVQFSEDLVVTKDILTLYNNTTSAPVNLSGLTPADFNYVESTWTAMRDLSVVDFNDGNHTATILASLIVDTGHNYLDGNGDGSGGDDYTFDFHQLLGDFDNSQNVDFIDYSVFANKWQDVNCVEPCWCGGADCEPDGVVDTNDLTAFAEHWLDSF